MDNLESHILYLDDEQVNLNVFYAGFSQYFKVHIANNLNEAMGILKQHPIKVILTDQRMPDISGLGFIELVKNDYPDIVSIIFSGYADKDVLFKAINKYDVFGIIEKPGQFEVIKHTIDNAVDKYNALMEKQRVDRELKVALEKASESDRLKAEFLRSISHEIRTPVNIIVGFAGLMLSREENEVYKRNLKFISDSAHKLVSIVDDMITVSRIKSGTIGVEKNEIFLNDLLEELYCNFSTNELKKESVELKVVKRKGGIKIPITTDKEKLYNIFAHLLKNAIKFTDDGLIEFGVYDEKKSILFVRDTGIGLKENDQHAIFDYFRQGSQKALSSEIDGIGVGLSIVKGLVKLLDGKIWVESSRGKGTTFYFSIKSVHSSPDEFQAISNKLS